MNNTAARPRIEIPLSQAAYPWCYPSPKGDCIYVVRTPENSNQSGPVSTTPTMTARSAFAPAPHPVSEMFSKLTKQAVAAVRRVAPALTRSNR